MTRRIETMAIQIPGYRVIRKINQGGMSTVYLAIQISVGRVVALKVMNPQFNNDPGFSERFQREANIVGQLSHPSIVSIYDIGRHEDLNYIAMDYLPNGTVHDKMANGISGEEALRITKAMASALDHSHEKGYIHRDIKPENILFRADNSAVLSDFGVARGMAVSSRMTQVGTVVGTPHYMSPEQTKGKQVDGRSDLYSLGIVLFEMLTGVVPYQGDEAVTIALKHISAPVPKLPMQYMAYQKLIDKLLAKDPEQRFQRGKELVAAIEELEKANPIHLGARTTHPADMTVLSLLSALIAATLSALRWRWNKLRNLRWEKERGFYSRQPSKITDIFFNELHESAAAFRANRAELDTRIHAAVTGKQSFFSSLFLLIMVLGTIAAGVYWFNKPADPPVDTTPLSNNQSSIASTSSRSAVIRTNKESTATLPTTSAPAELVANHPDSTSTVANTPVETETATVPTSTPTAEITLAPEDTQTVPTIHTYALDIATTPENAKIRILNIPDRYKPGIQLEPGRYHIEVSAPGFDTQRNWIDIDDQNLIVNINLKQAPTVETQTTKHATGQGPEMVEIPAGSFFMGNKDDTLAMPVHKVSLRTFAISKFEITFDDYDAFAKATKRALPNDQKWGRGNHPVINVSYIDAQAYTEWLSQTTGKKYRLPTESEWEYAARGRSQTTFWWGNDDKDAAGRANCRRGCNSKYSGLFGSKTAPVGSYPGNSFGVYDTAGNVSEWVQDCYAENYNLHPKNGQAYEVKNCESRVVRGGSAKHTAQQLATHIRDYYPPEIFNEHLGFRVVKEL